MPTLKIPAITPAFVAPFPRIMVPFGLLCLPVHDDSGSPGLGVNIGKRVFDIRNGVVSRIDINRNAVGQFFHDTLISSVAHLENKRVVTGSTAKFTLEQFFELKKLVKGTVLNLVSLTIDGPEETLARGVKERNVVAKRWLKVGGSAIFKRHQLGHLLAVPNVHVEQMTTAITPVYIDAVFCKNMTGSLGVKPGVV